MTDTHKDMLANLVALSQIDGNLARIAAERKHLESDLANLKNELKKVETDQKARSKVLGDKRTLVQREEKRIAEEREKLIGRRKALSTLGNYKLQQAAEKEIDHASKDIDVHENTVLAMMEEVESLGAALKDLDTLVAQRSDQLKSREDDVAAILSSFEERTREYVIEREKLAKNVPPANMTTYDQVRKRYPTDAVVLLNKDSCSGCFMQLGPQALVQISRGDQLVRCRGCGRILYLS